MSEKKFKIPTEEDTKQARETLVKSFHQQKENIFDDEAIKNLLKLVRVLEKRK